MLRTAILARTPGIAGGRQDVDQALAHFRHFELEQFDQELRRGARQEQLRAARLGAHFLQVGLDAVLRAHRLARDHLLARDEAFGVGAEIHVHAVAVDALDDAADQRAGPVLVGIDHLRALGLAHLLHDDLLGGLRENAAERHRFHRLLDEAARLHVLVDVARVIQAQLALRHLEFGGIVGEHLPAAKRVVAAGLAVDRNAHVQLFAVLLAGRGRERGFERVEYDFLVDALLVGDRVDRHQNFFVHRP